jgi:uncharacterized protein YjbI with pentapeptide repeats
MSQANPPIHQQPIEFERVSEGHEYAAFLNASIASLIAHLDVPIYDGYDDIDRLQFACFTLESGETVTLGEYVNSPQPGTSLAIDCTLENIPQVIFASCQQLQIPRAAVLWLHPYFQAEVDRLYAEQGNIRHSQVNLIETSERAIIHSEPFVQHPSATIECFHHALKIYPKQYFPLYWGLLQHDLGLAYFDCDRGDRLDNLERSIVCFHNSLEIYTQAKFPEKWQIDRDNLLAAEQTLQLLLEAMPTNTALHSAIVRSAKQHSAISPDPNPITSVIKNVISSGANLVERAADLFTIGGISLIGAELSGQDLRGANLTRANLRAANLSGARLTRANLRGVNLAGANLRNAQLIRVNLSGVNYLMRTNLIRADLRGVDLRGANLTGANLMRADLRDADLRGVKLMRANLNGADVDNARFTSKSVISASMRQDLIARGAIFDDSQSDRFHPRGFVSP